MRTSNRVGGVGLRLGPDGLGALIGLEFNTLEAEDADFGQIKKTLLLVLVWTSWSKLSGPATAGPESDMEKNQKYKGHQVIITGLGKKVYLWKCLKSRNALPMTVHTTLTTYVMRLL